MAIKERLIKLLPILFGALNLSTGGQDPGLLTSSYGIVTDQDLKEEWARCTDVGKFPDQHPCFNYWQCLPTNSIKMFCDRVDDPNYFDQVGEVELSIGVNGITHSYFTRRNFSFEDCENWLAEWSELIAGEEVVCLSGTYLGFETGDSVGHQQPPKLIG